MKESPSTALNEGKCRNTQIHKHTITSVFVNILNINTNTLGPTLKEEAQQHLKCKQTFKSIHIFEYDLMTKCLLRWKSVCFNWTTMLLKSVMMCSRFAYLLKSSNLKTRDVPRKRRKSRLAKDPAAQITGQKCIFLLLLLLMLTISKEQLGRKGRRSQGRRDGVTGYLGGEGLAGRSRRRLQLI